MGRPALYATPEARLQARREKTRQYVRAFRARQKVNAQSRKVDPDVRKDGVTLGVESDDDNLAFLDIRRTSASSVNSTTTSSTHTSASVGQLLRSASSSPRPRWDSGLTLTSLRPSNDFQGTSEELMLWSYFRAVVVERAAILWFDSAFWRRAIPQASLREPVIRDAVLAFAAQHREFESSRRLSRFGQLTAWSPSVRRYLDRAMENLKEVDEQNVDVILMACLLFVTLSVMAREDDKTIAFIQHGVRVVNAQCGGKQHNIGHHVGGYLSNKAMIATYRRLDTQASYWTSLHKPMLTVDLDNMKIPPIFDDVEDASNSLTHIQHRLVSRTSEGHTPPIYMISQMLKILQLLDEWEIAFTNSIKLLQSDKKEDLLSMAVLRLRLANIRILATPEGIMKPRALSAHYAIIVNQATEAYDLERRCGRRLGVDRILVAPLHFTIKQCPDPAVRAAAVALFEDASSVDLSSRRSCLRSVLSTPDRDVPEVSTSNDERLNAFENDNIAALAIREIGGQYTRAALLQQTQDDRALENLPLSPAEKQMYKRGAIAALPL